MSRSLNILRELVESMMDDDYEAAVVHGNNLVNELEDKGCPSQGAIIRVLKDIAKDAAKYVEEAEDLEDLDFEPEDEDDIDSELDFSEF